MPDKTKIDNSTEWLSPNTKASNLSVKKIGKKKRKANDEKAMRRKLDIEKAKGANIIFGLDNGATGTVSCIIPYSDDDIDVHFSKTFANLEMDYQKDLQKIARIDWQNLKEWFEKIIKKAKKNYNKKYKVENPKIVIGMERPMINAERFKQSKNAARAFESTLIVIEMLDLKDNYIILDSKKWQHHFFGKNTETLDLKKASKDKGIEYLKSLRKKHTDLQDIIVKHGDADSLLIAKYILEKLV